MVGGRLRSPPEQIVQDTPQVFEGCLTDNGLSVGLEKKKQSSTVKSTIEYSFRPQCGR